MPSLLWQLHHSDDGSSFPPVAAAAAGAAGEASSSRNHHGNDLRRTKSPAASSSSLRNRGEESRRTREVREVEEVEEQEEEEEGESSGATRTVAAPPSSRRTSRAAYTKPDELPSLDSAFSSFLDEHPSFQSTTAVDDTRESDYPHLRAANRACFDYCGFGLFSFSQRFTAGHSRSSFALVSAATSGSLAAQATLSTSEPGSLQSELRTRVLEYLNVGDGSYRAVFTASKRAAFGLVADCYNFRSRSKLVTVYDHDSESVKALTAAAVRSGAKTSTARFRWPTLRLCGEQLAAVLKTKGSRLLKKRSGGGTAGGTAGGKRRGLFVFPTQSRITGTKYSYQWMTMAEKHRWDVLLDVSAMGPRDMGSLGLSLFRPDFIVCSFYKVFGSDPTGFGCLLIKDSSVASLRSSSASSLGMVRVVPDLGDDEGEAEEEAEAAFAAGRPAAVSDLIAFSGPVLDRDVVAAGASFPFGSAEIDCEEDEEELGRKGGGENGKGGEENAAIDLKDTNGFVVGSSREFSSEIQEVGESVRSSSTSFDPSCSYAQDEQHDKLPNGDAAASSSSSDSIFRKIGRDDGFIDSRRSDLFPRFLPIREEEEDEDHLGTIDEQFIAQSSSTAVDPDSSSRRSFTTSGRRSWRKNSSSWDGEGDYYYDDDDIGSDEEAWDEDDLDDDLRQQREQQRRLIVCQGLDHAKTMGLNKTNCRIKNLMDWLIASLSSLFHHIPGQSTAAATLSTKRWRRRPLVQIFGPKAQIDRGPAVAFNLYDHKGVLIQPTLVQKLADRSSISLGCGCLTNLYLEEVAVTSGSDRENAAAAAATKKKRLLPEKCSSMAVFLDHSGSGAAAGGSMKKLSDLPVLTATLGLVSNFEDVYRLWTFVAKFLEAEFLAGELLRYQSLNQSVVVLDEEQEAAAAVAVS